MFSICCYNVKFHENILFKYVEILFKGGPGIIYGSVDSRKIEFGSGGADATTTHGAGK